MPLFRVLSASDVGPGIAIVLAEVEINYAALQDLFDQLHASEGRLKTSSGVAIAAPQMARELATVYALHSLEHCRGIAALLDESNPVAALPVARSLWEVFTAACYALEQFTTLVVKGRTPQRFELIGHRLLTGRSKGPEGARYVPPARMMTAAKRFVSHGSATRAQRRFLEDQFQRIYDTLSDGAHPTRLGLVSYQDERADQRGVDWSRRPNPGTVGVDHVVTIMRMPLSHLLLALPQLAEAADSA